MSEGIADPLGSPLARSIFEAAAEGLLVISADETILAMNRSFAGLYELNASALVGQNWTAIAADLEVHRVDRSIDSDAWVTQRAVRGEKVEGVLQTIRNARTGREFVARCRAEPFFIDGQFVATTVSVEDVTEATRAAQRLDSALSAAEIGTYRIDVPEGKTWGDANLAKICGLTLEEVSGGPVTRLYESIHPDDLDRVREAVDYATRTGLPHEIQYRVVLPGGEKWLLSRGVARLDEQGVAVQRLGSIVDITNQKAAEEALRRANDALEAAGRVAAELSADLPLEQIVQTITDASTLACGAQFGAFFYNVVAEAGESYMLYTVSGVPREAFSKFPMPRVTPIFGPTFMGQGPIRSEDITRDPRYGTMAPHYGMPAGHLPVRSYLAAPVISRTGEVLGGLFYGHGEIGKFGPEEERLALQYAAFASVGIDNARLYEQVLGISDELEQRVAARTDELTRANQDLSDFSYSVAHDLRAPLRAIVATSRILLEDVGERLSPAEQEMLERQAKNSVRLARIVDDLLAFARLAKAEIRKQPFDMTVLARTVAEEVGSHRKVAGEASVQAEMNAYGDANLLGYALTNLIDNAFKFSPKGGPVTVGEIKGAFFVKDEGVGFDMAHAEKLFVAFERLVDQEAFEGTGVGLANVKRIIDRHGGRVWAESEKGKGSTFWFTLGDEN